MSNFTIMIYRKEYKEKGYLERTIYLFLRESLTSKFVVFNRYIFRIENQKINNSEQGA